MQRLKGRMLRSAMSSSRVVKPFRLYLIVSFQSPLNIIVRFLYSSDDGGDASPPRKHSGAQGKTRPSKAAGQLAAQCEPTAPQSLQTATAARPGLRRSAPDACAARTRVSKQRPASGPYATLFTSKSAVIS
jgi:hypothetical protein